MLCGQEEGVLLGGGLVAAGGADGVDGPIAHRSDLECEAAGGLQAFGGVGAQQSHEAETTAIALFGVGAALEEPFDERGRARSGLATPCDEPRRGPLGVGAVGPRQGWKKTSLPQVLQRSYSLTPRVIGMLRNR